jgi:hypothetical protein
MRVSIGSKSRHQAAFLAHALVQSREHPNPLPLLDPLRLAPARHAVLMWSYGGRTPARLAAMVERCSPARPAVVFNKVQTSDDLPDHLDGGVDCRRAGCKRQRPSRLRTGC